MARRLDSAAPISGARDPRRWIYAGLDGLAAVVYALVLWKAIPNRQLSASLHLWLMPPAAAAAGIGMAIGGRRGWALACASCTVILAAAVALIARLLVSAAFLAGVYGAFGQGAASAAIVGVALVIEVVALLPIAQVRYLLGRAGRRRFAAEGAGVLGSLGVSGAGAAGIIAGTAAAAATSRLAWLVATAVGAAALIYGAIARRPA